MGHLKQHYGSDASLDEASVQEVSRWLNTHAGTYKRLSEAPPQDRITTSAWFVREHREVPSEVCKRAAVGNQSNCVACHTKAAEGGFNERDIRISR
jgi:cytochrome c